MLAAKLLARRALLLIGAVLLKLLLITLIGILHSRRRFDLLNSGNAWFRFSCLATHDLKS